MKNIPQFNSNLTKETKIIGILLIIIPLIYRYILAELVDKSLARVLYFTIFGALLGMLYMHLHDLRKFRSK